MTDEKLEQIEHLYNLANIFAAIVKKHGGDLTVTKEEFDACKGQHMLHYAKNHDETSVTVTLINMEKGNRDGTERTTH